MKNELLTPLSLIDDDYKTSLNKLISWCNVNTHSYNKRGLETLLADIKEDVSILDGEVKEVKLPAYIMVDDDAKKVPFETAPLLSIKKRLSAKKRVLLGIHIDTVFPLSSPFQKVSFDGTDVLKGPGVIDAKGGLVVMLLALKAFESSKFAKNLGWEVFINPDEEIGSPCSSEYLSKISKEFDLGLVFEPTLADNKLVKARKGSKNLVVVVIGKAAHAGREPDEGRSAIDSLAKFILESKEALSKGEGVLFNTGVIKGGVAENIVPELATARINVRMDGVKEEKWVMETLQSITSNVAKKTDTSLEINVLVDRPPKPETKPTQKLIEEFKICAQMEGYNLSFKAVGGVSDGNILAAHGLYNLDSLGACGGNPHTQKEYLVVSSIRERARLIALFLMRLASGEVQLPSRN